MTTLMLPFLDGIAATVRVVKSDDFINVLNYSIISAFVNPKRGANKTSLLAGMLGSFSRGPYGFVPRLTDLPGVLQG